jgi:hypothetical protein
VLEAVDAFYLKHRLCGQLDGGFEDCGPSPARGYCSTCGVEIMEGGIDL